MRFRAAARVFVYCAIVGCAFSAFASTTRDKGLGLDQYSWFIDGLEGRVFENPAYLGNYKDRAFAERNGVTDALNMGGIYYSPVDGLTLGLHFGLPVDNSVWDSEDAEGLFHHDIYSVKGKNKYSTAAQTFDGYQFEMNNGEIIDLMDPADGSALVGTDTSSPVLRESLDQKNLSAICSYSLGSWVLGGYFGYATSWGTKRYGATEADTHDEYSFKNDEYSAMLGTKGIIGTVVDMDISGYWKMYSLKNEYTKKLPGIDAKMTYKSDGAMDFGGSLAVGYKMTEVHKSHFFASYAMLNRSTKGSMRNTDQNTADRNVNASDTFSRKGSTISLGVSDEIKVSNDLMGFVGFSAEYTLFKNEYSGKDSILPANNVDKYTMDSKSISVPLIVGLESKLSEKWKGRFGLTQMIYKPLTDSGKNISSLGKVSSPTSKSENESSSTTMSLGLTYVLNSFTFDWVVSADMFTSGPYIVSGKTWSGASPTPMATSFGINCTF